MSRRTTRPKSVLILGSGALKIGEAGEFDYSGSQAIKALKEEGIRVILVNPNIATIQTSEHLADRVYFLPVEKEFVSGVIERERPEGILLGFGGQTALNCGLQLEADGVLEQYGVRVLGTPVEAIRLTEDRQLFADSLASIGVDVPRSKAVTTTGEALAVAEEIGYPVMVRSGFSLGGLGSGVMPDREALEDLATKSLTLADHILIEEYLHGWKEVEYEVMRDNQDNCVTICNMENLDPLGIHTGESIVVAPSQTLSNEEYHRLREIAVRVIRHLGIVGECNIQYALDPESEEYRVIEVNARLSRSSALASKATGYPLAAVAARLALGFSLTEIRNAVTRVTMACFEPALDYVVVKIPRWDLRKFRRAVKTIGTGMKSVGEVMAIGRTFPEALQKALRMLEIGARGLIGDEQIRFDDLEEELRHPTDERIFALARAMDAGWTPERIHEMTRIDFWFLHEIEEVVHIASTLRQFAGGDCPGPVLRTAKQAGFADEQIALLIGRSEDAVRRMRRSRGIVPCVKQIDTLAAEYPAATNYLYLTYQGQEDDVTFDGAGEAVLVLGSGAYRIGSSVEFDWCCVNAVRTLKQLGYRTLMANYNPETVSTDYDECDRLYFDELNLETVLEICAKETPKGVVVSMGGQVPNTLAPQLAAAGLTILGTSSASIDRAEDRHKFSSLLDSLGIDQPEWTEAASVGEATAFAEQVGYPVLVRPSYVLSGSAMGVAVNGEQLARFMARAEDISTEHPVVVSKFIMGAKEIEMDAVAANGEVEIYAISEHVENAGVHSGDATLVLPPQRTYLETTRRIKRITRKIARALEVSGPFNIQFIARENAVKVIECNLRASRSFPFVSKVCKENFIEAATKAVVGEPVEWRRRSFFELDYVGVKAPQFSFTRLHGADPVLGVEMASTGEVGCLGDDFGEAFLKAMHSVGYQLSIGSVLLSTGPIESKADFLAHARMLAGMGIRFYATRGTGEFLGGHGLETTILNWPLEKGEPNVMGHIADGKVDLVINIPKNFQEEEVTNDYLVRRQAVDFGVPLVTNLQLAKRLVEALQDKRREDLLIKSWEEY